MSFATVSLSTTPSALEDSPICGYNVEYLLGQFGMI